MDIRSLSMASPPHPSSPLAPRTLTVAEGDHTLELAGLAANCSVAAGVTRSVRVVANQDTPVAFDVVCMSTAGGLRVTVVTTGPQQDADGYGVEVDGGAPQTVAANASVMLTALRAGDHVVRLLAVAENCTVTGENPRTVAVVAGDVVEVVFELTCIATLGGVLISTSTTGSGTDDDGYTVRVDDGPEQSIGQNGTLVVAGLAPGTRAVTLGGVASNCAVDGENPRAVEVPAGDPVPVEFRISCASGVRQWTMMTSGTTADLPDVWGSSASHVFVVGELPVDANDDIASVIMHFDGTAWRPQLTATNVMLQGVWGSSENDVYAAGFDLGGNATMLRYDGSQWSEVPGFEAGPSELLFLRAVWGNSASDIFAVGTSVDGPFSSTLIFHYDGNQWQRMPPPSGRAASELTDVWGSSGTDVYAVGFDQGAGAGVILHYDGGGWTPALERDGLRLNSVWGTSADDVYAAGFRFDDDFNVFGTILHFDGDDWSDVDLPPSDVLNQLWASSPDDVFAVGFGGTVLHYDGSGWTKTNPTTTDLFGIWGLSSSDVFAVGAMGTILRGTP